MYVCGFQTAAIMEENLVRHDPFSDEVGRLAMSAHASLTSSRNDANIGTGVCKTIRRQLETQRGGLTVQRWLREKKLVQNRQPL